MQNKVFNPLAAFGVRPLPGIGARAGRWFADNLAKSFGTSMNGNSINPIYLIWYLIRYSRNHKIERFSSQRLEGLLRELPNQPQLAT